MTNSEITWEIIRDPRAFCALENEWNDLWTRAGGEHVVLRFHWCWSAWQHVATALGRRLHCVVGRRDGSAVLIWPFVAYRFALWRRARPLGPEGAEYSSVLIDPAGDAEACLAKAWDLLCRTLHCDSVLLPFVPDGSRLQRFIERDRRPVAKHSIRISSARFDSEADRLQAIEMIDRSSLNRRRRQLAKLGAVRHEHVTDPERRRRAIDWIVSRKEAWFARTGERPLWRRTDLYRAFLIDAAAESGVGVFALTLNGDLVAGCVARVDAVRFEQFLSAYDDDHSKYSPGQLLRSDNLRWSFERGLEYDLRVGDQDYKSEWSNRSSVAISYNVAISAWGRAAIRVRSAREALSRVKLVTARSRPSS